MAGDAQQARATLESIVRDAESRGVRVPSPAARVVGEALVALGELDERDIAMPAPGDTDRFDGVGVVTFRPVQIAGQRASDRYAKVAAWGSFDLLVCTQRRQGRVSERVAAIAVSMEARDLATLRQRPDATAFEILDEPGLRAEWSGMARQYRSGARIYYEGALLSARMLNVAAAIDPLDGADCRADALARRDAIDASGDAGH
jgi:hypothetical protein